MSLVSIIANVGVFVGLVPIPNIQVLEINEIALSYTMAMRAGDRGIMLGENYQRKPRALRLKIKTGLALDDPNVVATNYSLVQFLAHTNDNGVLFNIFTLNNLYLNMFLLDNPTTTSFDAGLGNFWTLNFIEYIIVGTASNLSDIFARNNVPKPVVLKLKKGFTG